MGVFDFSEEDTAVREYVYCGNRRIKAIAYRGTFDLLILSSTSVVKPQGIERKWTGLMVA